MRPPECYICGDEDGCKLIYFKKSLKQKVDDLIRDIKFMGKGWSGHPDHVEWFCKKHFEIAKKYQNLTKKDAFKKIKEESK